MCSARKVSIDSSPKAIYSHTIGVYTIDQSRRILLAGKEIGLAINFHGDELNYTGSAEVRTSVDLMTDVSLR